MDTEEDFPRGRGERPVVQSRGPTPKVKKDIPNLFKVHDRETPDENKKKRKRKKQLEDESTAKKKKTDVFDLAAVTASQMQELLYQNVTEGLKVLGRVKAIGDYDLEIGLPNGLHGTVPLTGICEAYTQQLQAVAEEDEDGLDTDYVHGLQDLFSVGDVVRCIVTSVKENERGKKSIELSIDPQLLCQYIKAKALLPSMLLCGCVSSVEDHGYTVDLGIKGLSAFLSNQAAKKFIEEKNEGQPLFVGKFLPCVLKNFDAEAMKTGTSRVVSISADPKLTHKAKIPVSATTDFQSLLPGMKIKCTIVKITDAGLVLKFVNEKYQGFAHRSHLPKNPKTYVENIEVLACVLYIEPMNKSVSLSLLPHLLNHGSEEFTHFQKFMVHQVIEEARVKNVEPKRGVLLELDDGVRGFVMKKQVSDSEVSDLKGHIKKNTKVKCRLLDYNIMDNIAMLTMKESLVEVEYMDLNDIEPGSVIQGTVKKVTESLGVVVMVTRRIPGFIPNMHLGEVALKHPEKKYTEGKVIKCRVLSVNPEKKKLVLTCKKSLLKSKLPILTRFDQLTPGLVVEGFIVKALSSGVVVAFYNNIKGFVPKRELGFEKIDYPEKVFYKGQVVKACVLDWDLDTKNITLSFKLGSEDEERKDRKSVLLKKASEKIDFCEIVECTVQDKGDLHEKAQKGLNVFIEKLKIKAFIPILHLSDHSANCRLMYDMYEQGDVIENAMCFSKAGNIILTLKPSLITASKEDILPKTFDEIQPGMMVPGVMRHQMSYGIFLDLAYRMQGLVPNRYLNDVRLPTDAKPYEVQQSLVAKVTEVDQEKKRCLLSLRMCDVYHGNTEIGVELVSNCLEERAMIFKSLGKRKDKKTKKLLEFEVGALYPAKLTKLTEHGALCQMENGIKGVVTVQHMGDDESKVGNTLDAMILFVDIEACCVELSIKHEHIKMVKNRPENKYTEAKVGQHIKSEVVLIKDDFIVVMLKAHASGRLAYLPAKRHLNDVFEKSQFEVGQINRVIIRRHENGCVIAGWHMYEEELQKRTLKNSLSAPARVERHDLGLGDIVTAHVKEILPFQLNVEIGRTPGRVFVSEVKDKVENGVSPLSGFKVKDEIKVKIIGFRDTKTQKSIHMLLRNQNKMKKAIPECTLKHSKVSRAGFQPEEDGLKNEYPVGAKVPAFVHNYHNHCLWMRIGPECKARVYVLNISNDLKVLEDVESHMKIGECQQTTVINNEGESLEISLIENYEVKPGAVVNGQITSVTPTCVKVQLASRHWGTVHETDMMDEYMDKPGEQYKVDQFVKCYVLSCTDEKHCKISLRKSRISSTDCKFDREIKSWQDIKKKMVLRGYMKHCSINGGFVNLSEGITGHVPFSYLSAWNLNTELAQVFFRGKVVTAKVISVKADEKKLILSLLEHDTGVPETVPDEMKESRRTSRKRKTSESEHQEKRVKVAEEADSGIEDHKETADLSSDEEVAPSKEKSRLNLSTGFTWDNSFTLPEPSGGQESSSESDSDNEVAERPEVKKTKEEKAAEKKAEERKLYEAENLYLDNERLPETAEDFDRLCLQSPNSSLVWLRYMAFHLETTEIEKARAVAERALKTISFREEQEKLNIWVAYLNLENMYGTPESLQQLFQKALQHNDPLKVFQQLVTIYIKSEKFEAAEQMYQTMVKRFSLRKEIWINFGFFYFKNQQFESARKLMQRCLKSLDQRHHVEVIAKFAQLEFKLGDPERGTTMFENILSNYPKRVDLWSVYLDMLTKKGDMEQTRSVYERVINLSVSAKKMKFFFKKYMDFEKKYGTEESVSEVKRKAVEYVEAKATEMDS